MSDEPTEAPDETPQDAPSDDDDQGEHDEQGEHDAARSEPQDAPQAPPTTDAADPRAVKKLTATLDKERERHAKRLGEILGDAATDTLPCPLCFEQLQGFVIPAALHDLTDEQRGALSAILGVADPSEMPEREGYETCSTCNGFGEVRNPTRVPHYATAQCADCGGQGFKPIPGAGGQVLSMTATPTTTYTVPPSGNGPCPICGTPNTAGLPHYCNPAAGQAG